MPHRHNDISLCLQIGNALDVIPMQVAGEELVFVITTTQEMARRATRNTQVRNELQICLSGARMIFERKICDVSIGVTTGLPLEVPAP